MIQFILVEDKIVHHWFENEIGTPKTLSISVSVLQIKGVTMIIKGNFSLFFRLSIHCDPSLEPSRRDGSKEGSQCMFLLRNKKLFLNYPK